MATPEKALLDTLYYRGNLPVADELELERVDREALIKMVKKFPSSILRKIPLILNSKTGLDLSSYNR